MYNINRETEGTMLMESRASEEKYANCIWWYPNGASRSENLDHFKHIVKYDENGDLKIAHFWCIVKRHQKKSIRYGYRSFDSLSFYTLQDEPFHLSYQETNRVLRRDRNWG